MDLFDKEDFEKNVTYSRWCTGERPIPKEILSFYDSNDFDGMQDNIENDVLPNLINTSATRTQLMELVTDSIDVIGIAKADEFARITDMSEYITALIRYAILNDHDSRHTLLSPDLADQLISNRLPSINQCFIGRKEELKAVSKALQEHNLVFVTGTAGMGKSELAKTYAKKNEKKYTNILYFFYDGDLKKCISNMEFNDDTSDMSEAVLFEKHMKTLKKLHSDSIVIIDNFNVLPKEDAFFKEFIKLNCKILITSRCNISQYETIKVSEMDADTDNKKISLHPLLQEVIATETLPTVTACKTMLDNLHLIGLAHGLELRRPENIIASLISVNERIVIDDGAYFLLFLQDMFPYLDKYLVTDYLPKLVERISYIMEEYKLESPCDKALLLDYKAECFLLKKDYGNAVKRREKAISILEKLHDENADIRTVSLLSNLYNNLSNTYLLMKRGNDAARALRTAFDIRLEYAHLGLTETHDSLQQMMNLINMLLLAKDSESAKIVLSQYEALVLEHLSETSLDYGICKLSHGMIDMMDGKPEQAELNLLSAENIICNALGNDNDYTKTVYRYLNNLYARCGKQDKAIEYRDKYFEVNRITTKKNA